MVLASRSALSAFRAVALAFALVSAIIVPAASFGADPPRTYPTVDAAKQHCPTDVVVWINTKSGVYHYPGQRWYGATKQGAYACEKEAPSLGARATKNGQ